MKVKFNQNELFEQGLKGCPKCDKIKPLSEFYNNPSRKDGFHNQCKDCSKNNSRNWAKTNPEKNRIRSNRWRNNNRDKIKEIDHNSYIKHKQSRNKKSVLWEKNHREIRNKIVKKYIDKNREKVNSRRAKCRLIITDGYLRSLIKDQFNIPANETPQIFISEKREQLQYKREIKLLTKKLKENEKVN